MARLFARLGLILALLVVAAPAAFAEEPESAKDEIPAIYASDDDAAEALAEFKTEYKAKGLKGDDKAAQRVWAIKRLATVQHKKVADKLIKLMKQKDPNIKTAAVQYLGAQRALPGYAGLAVIQAMGKNQNDSVFLISGLQAIQDLEYQGASETLKELMKHKDYAVQKSAMFAIGELADLRLLEEVYQLMAKIKKAKGESWDGVSVSVDTGTAGDGDQREAERQGAEQMAKNKRKGRRGGRSKRDLGPVVEEVLKTLTGQEFATGEACREWMKAEADEIASTQQALKAEAKAQNDAAKKLK